MHNKVIITTCFSFAAAATSRAPAGQVYRGVEHAGKSVLADHAGGFPSTDISSILPPVFVTTYPEPRDRTGDIEKNKTRNLNNKEEIRFHGDNNNAGGESAKFDVAKNFQKILRQKGQPATLIMRSFQLGKQLQPNTNKKKTEKDSCGYVE